MPGQSVMNSPRFQSKCIVIVNCDLFFHYCNAKEISLYYIVVMQNFLQNMNLFVIAHLYWWDDVFKVNEWCLIDCFHCKCRVSTQVMVLHFPLKKFSSCSRLLKALSTIFFLQFKTVTLIWTLSPMVILSFLSLMLLLIFAVYFLCKNCKLPIPPTPRKVTPHMFRPFGRPVYWFDHPNSGDQKILFKFSFFSCIST